MKLHPKQLAWKRACFRGVLSSRKRKLNGHSYRGISNFYCSNCRKLYSKPRTCCEQTTLEISSKIRVPKLSSNKKVWEKFFDKFPRLK